MSDFKVLDEWVLMYSTLLDDVGKCVSKLQESEGDQFWRRTFIRSFFALVEGNNFGLKQVVLEAHRVEKDLFSQYGVTFSEEEIALLKEKAFNLNDKGEAYAESKFLKLESNMKFAFYMMARMFILNYKLRTDSEGWMAFKLALHIRHRLTHPKFNNDIYVSDAELQTARNAFSWYITTLNEFYKECTTSPQIEMFIKHRDLTPL